MYEILSSYLSAEQPARRVIRGTQSHQERFLAAVASAEDFRKIGSIPNVQYKNLKDIANDAVDSAIDAVRGKHVIGRYLELPEDVRTFLDKVDTVCPYLHTIPGRLAKAQKTPADHPYRTDLIALMTEIIPLVDLFAALKNMVAKRQAKPVEVPATGYTPPPVSTAAEQRVVALLETVTKAEYLRLKTLLVDNYQRVLADYLTAQEKARLEAKFLSPHDHFIGKSPLRARNYAAYDLVNSVTEITTSHARHAVYAAMDDVKVRVVFLKLATDTADHYRRSFVYKNFRKIASIIEAKGGCETARAIEHSVSLSGMKGSFLFTFRDGSRFEVVNEVVFVVNSHGTAFNRFPLTFRGVIMPDGSAMGRPSEQRMNTVFVGKT